MRPEARDPVERARRRARRGTPWRRRVLNTILWTGLGAWVLELAGWLPDLPMEWLFGPLLFVGADAITLPFRRRARPLLLPGARPIPLAELRHMAAERHVHVRGRIRALERVSTYLGEIDDAVYSHAELVATISQVGTISQVSAPHRDLRVYHVQRRDFLLVDENGATVEIRMHQAEVKPPRRTLYLHDHRVAWAFLGEFGGLRPTRLHRPIITEHWLANGDEIEVLGTVERVADPRQEALPRQLPTRPVLISVRGRPLTVQLVRAR
jgi:hypothetical protein